MTINERIAMVRKHADMSMQKFGDRIKISRGAVSMIENGTNNPSRQTVDLICREFNVRRDWLETGQGDMYNLPLDEEAAMFARLSKISSASASALKAVIRFYLELGDDGMVVLDKLIEDAIKKDPE